MTRNGQSEAARLYVGRELGLKQSTRNDAYRQILAEAGEQQPAAKSEQPKVPSATGGAAGEFDASMETSAATTIEQVVDLLGVDLAKWQPRGFSVRNAAKGGYGWNARFAPRPECNHTIIEDLKRDLLAASRLAPPLPVKHKLSSGGRLWVVALFDAHLGKLSWKEADGHNYDLKIAKEVFMLALEDMIVKAAKQGPVSRILFPVGNDYMTCDTDLNQTTAGTPQSVDGRFPKIYREARQLLVQAIERLRQIAPVDVVVVPGNHDRTSMFHLGDALDCWFHGYKDVTVDNRWVPRKYYAFGDTVFGLTHGDTIKHDKLPLIGAVQEPKLWAQCKRRVWLLGHLHHFSLKEYMGVQVRILPSLSGSDGYHEANGFIGSARCAITLVYSEAGHEASVYSEPEN